MDDSQWTVGPESAGGRLDKFLAAAGRLETRGRAVAAIERGKIFVNDVEATKADAARRVAEGDRVRVWMDRPGSARRRTSPHQAGDLAILYEDADVIAVNKPPGLLTVPLERRGEAGQSVLGLLKEYFRTDRTHRPLVVHRIDRDTSGVVLFAKHAAAQAQLKEQFLHREPERAYQAIVYGHPTPDAGTWRDHLLWDDRALIQKKTHPRDPRGKEAVSEYRTLDRYRDASLIEVRLVTGKRNQIRIQAGLRSHMLVGERRYVFGAERQRPIPFPRQALHAGRLALRHPTTGRPLAIEAPMPDDLAGLVSRLRRSARR
ncbi:MAG: RluA family pseudouridine synthase [Vicinamibacterales bacterium]